MTEEQFNAITEWQQETFPAATTASKVAHLVSETMELDEAIFKNHPERRLEFADCIFLLYGAAKSDGMTYWDICNAISEKFEINKKRTWGKPDERGIVNHIKNDEEA